MAEIFVSVPRRDQRAKGDRYPRGLMLDGRRTSIQPMAERLPDGDMRALQQFVSQSTWDHAPVLRAIATTLTAALTPRVWVIDDVSFPKDGNMSAGVAHQWCGALGEQANCQVLATLHDLIRAWTGTCPTCHRDIPAAVVRPEHHPPEPT